MGAIISVRELSAKRWKGSHVGEVWGPYSRYTTRRTSLMEASPEPHLIAQSNDSRFTGRSQAH